MAQQFELLERSTYARHQQLLEVLQIRFDVVDRQLEKLRDGVAGQFEVMQKTMDGRFEDLKQLLELRFTGLDRRIKRLEGGA